MVIMKYRPWSATPLKDVFFLWRFVFFDRGKQTDQYQGQVYIQGCKKKVNVFQGPNINKSQ